MNPLLLPLKLARARLEQLIGIRETDGRLMAVIDRAIVEAESQCRCTAEDVQQARERLLEMASQYRQ